MQTLLQIRSSLFSDNGESSRLANRFAEGWRAAHPGATFLVRDLALEPVPHLDAMRFGAFLAKPEVRTPEQASVVGYSDALIEELKQADVIVMGLPMYNFGVPSTLKAYFDHIARAGITFRYTDKGPIGMLTGKKVIVFAARGGLYAGTSRDTQSLYVRNFLGFLGMTDVEFVYAEGLAMGPDAKEDALLKARVHADRLSLPALVPA